MLLIKKFSLVNLEPKVFSSVLISHLQNIKYKPRFLLNNKLYINTKNKIKQKKFSK